MGVSTFVGRVQKLRRIVIPSPICEALEIKEGDKVLITIEKLEVGEGEKNRNSGISE